MHLRTTLILLLVAGFLALLVLLPRSPLVLEWLWQNAVSIADQEGFRLNADRLSGNAWGGVSIEGLSFSGRGVDLSSAEARVEYGLISLLTGKLALSAELSGVRGQVDPAALRLDEFGTSDLEVPVDLQNLTLTDLQLSVTEFDEYLPALTVDALEVVTEDGLVLLEGELSTTEGGASFSGHWDTALNSVTVDVTHADVVIARHWFPEATGGRVTAQVRGSKDGFELDAFIHDGSIYFLEVEVADISGPVTIRDLILHSELTGVGLEGPVQAGVSVNIPAESYRGILTGDVRLEGAVPWLGRNISMDLSAVPADGPMTLQVLVTGWEDTLVTGIATGTGMLAGLPLTTLQGEFDYRTETGVSVNAQGQLGGGQLSVRLLPEDPEATLLQVSLLDIEAFPGFSLDGQAEVHFDERPSGPAPSSARLALINPDMDLQFEAQGASSNTKLWTITASGLDGALEGSADLDLEAGLLDASVDLAGLQAGGLPWPLEASARAVNAPLELPLPLAVTAGLGPLQLRETTMILDSQPRLQLVASDESLALSLPRDGGLQVSISEPALFLDSQEQPLPVNGELLSGPQGLQGDLTAELELAGGTVQAELLLSDGDMQLSGSSDLLGQDWRLSGTLDPGLLLSAESELGQLQLAGDTLSGSGSVTLPEGLSLSGSETLQWQVDGSLLESRASLSSSASLLQLDWTDGLEVQGTLDQDLILAGQELRLQAELTPAGNISGQLANELATIQLDGSLDGGLGFSGDLEAATLQPGLNGTVSLSGRADWEGPLRVQATLNWLELEANLDWLAATEPLAVQVSGPGVEGELQDGTAALEFSGFQLNPYLDLAGIPAVIESGTVSGDLAELQLDLAGVAASVPVQVSGSVTPELQLTVTAHTEAAGQELSLTGLVTGPIATPQLEGSLQALSLTQAEGQLLRLEPLDLDFLLDSSGSLSVSGPDSELTYRDGSWQGSADAQLLIADEPHVLSVRPEAGQLAGSLTGTLLNGELTVSDEVSFDLSLAPGLEALGFLDGATLSGSSDLSGNFSAHLQAAASGLLPALEPLVLGAQLQGDLTGLTGIANLRGGDTAERLFTVSISSDWQDLQLTGDLAALAADSVTELLGIESETVTSGSVSLDLTGLTEPSWELEGGLTGTVVGAELDLQVTGAGDSIAVMGRLLGESVSLNASFGGELAATGDWGGIDLELTGNGDTWTGSLSSDEESALGAAELSFQVTNRPGGAQLEFLSGTVGAAVVNAQGTLTPQTAVQGSLQLEGLSETLPLTLSNEDGLQLSTDWRGLQLLAHLPGGQPELQLTGTMQGAALNSDLAWNAANGFSGSLRADGTYQGLPWWADATAVDGDLQLTGQLRFAEQLPERTPLLNLQASLAAQPLASNSLSGTVTSYFNLAELLPVVSTRSLSFSASARLSGSLFEPQLGGSALLMGAVEAEGRLQASTAGAELQLNGNGNALSASLDQDGWQLQAHATGVQLDQFSGILPGAMLNLQLNGGTGSPLQLSGLQVNHPEGQLTGSAALENGELSGQLNLDLNLAALDVGVGLSGAAQGSLRVTDWRLQEPGSGLVSGQVELGNLGVAGSNGLQGSIFLNGSPTAPRIAASLDTDAADGGLDLDWRPAESSIRLTALMDLGPVASDLYLQSSPETGQTAYGTVRVPGGSFGLSALEGGEFLLTGREAWTTWGVLIDPASRALQASGSLTALSEAVAGDLELTASLAGSGVQLSGGISGLEAAGINAGDVTIGNLSGQDAGLTLSGPALDGFIEFNGDWQLARMELAPIPGLSIVVSASGDLSGGSLSASLSGRLLDQPLAGSATAQLTPRGTSLNANVDVLGGAVSVDALLRQGNWQGQVELAGLLLSGISLSGSGGVFGPTASPRVELTSNANLLGIPGQGTFQLGPNLLSFHQTFTDPALGGDLVLQGSFWPQPHLALSGPDGNTFRLVQAAETSERPIPERRLVASGRLNVDSDTATVNLQAADNGDSARLDLQLGFLPDFAVGGDLQLTSLSSLMAQFDSGVQLQGRGETTGELSLDLLSGQLDLNGFTLRYGPGRFLLDGYANLSGTARVSGQFIPEASYLRDLPALSNSPSVPFALLSSNNQIRLVSSSRLGDMEASLDLSERRGSFGALLRSGDGNAELNLAWNEANGLTGSVQSTGFQLFELSAGAIGLLDTQLDLSRGRIAGAMELRLSNGQLSASGDWGLAEFLPELFAPFPQTGGQVDLRLSSLEISELPPVAQYAPALTGGVTAVVQLRDDVIAGNLVATGLQAAGSPLPIEAIISGSPRNIEVGASLAGSPLSVNLQDWTLSGLLEMRRFPLQTFAEAVAGPLDVSAEVTGVTRFSIPFQDLAQSGFQVATEQVWLERAGIVTTGNVSIELSSGVLAVSQASFSGAGSWEASGILRADLLDFELTAVEADFGPLLGLVPAFSQLGVSAEGSLSLTAAGDLADPQISLTSEQLAFEVAGISYLLDDLLLQLQQNQLSLAAELLATSPIQGALELSGSGGVSLRPLAFEDATFNFDGSLVLPVIGQVEGIDGRLYSADATPGAPLLAEVDAVMGNPLHVSGSITPLELQLSGRDLHVDLPGLFLDDSRLDADLTLRQDDGLVLGGELILLESLLNLSADAPPEGPDQPAAGISELLRFDDVHVVVPARLRLSESFGSAELAGDITVSGTLAEPLIAGQADVLRGNFQFAGRDFQLQEATATFDVTRGVYPELRLTATTTFDRTRLLPQGSNLQLVAPLDGSAVVTMSFAGAVEPDPQGGIRLNIDPVLSSNVLVRASDDNGFTGVPRALSEDELLALITLGRTDFASIVGQAGLAPMVAQGALETAVDLLIMSGLQRALGEALGLDLVEIRSTALSNLLTGTPVDQQFGISVRFGGYVSDEVFATYRVSAFDDPDGLYAFSNEVGIRYALGPVLLDLAGSLNVQDTAGMSAVAQLSLGLQYEINPSTTLEAAFDVSSQEQLFRFGVTWRW